MLISSWALFLLRKKTYLVGGDDHALDLGQPVQRRDGHECNDGGAVGVGDDGALHACTRPHPHLAHCRGGSAMRSRGAMAAWAHSVLPAGQWPAKRLERCPQRCPRGPLLRLLASSPAGAAEAAKVHMTPALCLAEHRCERLHRPQPRLAHLADLDVLHVLGVDLGDDERHALSHAERAAVVHHLPARHGPAQRPWWAPRRGTPSVQRCAAFGRHTAAAGQASLTTAPAAAATGPSCLLMEPPALKSAMSTPLKLRALVLATQPHVNPLLSSVRATELDAARRCGCSPVGRELLNRVLVPVELLLLASGPAHAQPSSRWILLTLRRAQRTCGGAAALSRARCVRQDGTQAPHTRTAPRRAA